MADFRNFLQFICRMLCPYPSATKLFKQSPKTIAFFGGRLREDFHFCRMVRLTLSLTRFAPTQKLLVPFNAFDGVI